MVGSSWEEAGGGREIEAVKICGDDHWERYLGYVRLYMHFVYLRHLERVDSRAAPCNEARRHREKLMLAVAVRGWTAILRDKE